MHPQRKKRTLHTRHISMQIAEELYLRTPATVRRGCVHTYMECHSKSDPARRRSAGRTTLRPRRRRVAGPRRRHKPEESIHPDRHLEYVSFDSPFLATRVLLHEGVYVRANQKKNIKKIVQEKGGGEISQCYIMYRTYARDRHVHTGLERCAMTHCWR